MRHNTDAEVIAGYVVTFFAIFAGVGMIFGMVYVVARLMGYT